MNNLKYYSAIWMILVGVAISIIAAYFSVVGLAALFAATPIGVIVMASSLEVGKVTVATWVHANWKKKKGGLLKGYMTGAVMSLMIITSMGIYGYLAKGHLEQSAPLAPVELQIEQKNTQIAQYKDQIVANKARLTQLDNAVNTIIGTDASKGLRARKAQTAERAEIKASIDATNADMNKVSQELVPLKLQVNAVETKLGPIKYVANFLGLKNPESAVNIVILLIMLAFDPLAIASIIAGASMLEETVEERAKRRDEDSEPEEAKAAASVDDEPEDDEPVAPINLAPPTDDPITLKQVQQSSFDAYPASMAEAVEAVEQVLAEEEEPEIVNEVEDDEPVEDYTVSDQVQSLSQDEREVMLSILERKPELLLGIVQAIRDADKQDPKNKSNGWLDV
jgi:hypothetical protein